MGAARGSDSESESSDEAEQILNQVTRRDAHSAIGASVHDYVSLTSRLGPFARATPLSLAMHTLWHDQWHGMCVCLTTTPCQLFVRASSCTACARI
jgi:hypothetical protein